MTRSRDVADTQKNIGGSVPPFAAGKNAIINGDFRINQRGFTSNTADLSFNFDRWRQTQIGGSFTITPQTFTAGNAISGYEPVNFVQCVTASQTASTFAVFYYNGIEDVRAFAGQTATISFWAKAASGTPSVGIELQQSFGSGGSATVTTSVSTITLSTSWTRYSATVSVPSVSGKTIGTGSTLQLLLWVSSGASAGGRMTNVGAQNATFQFWGFQMEAGSAATPFTTATGTIQGELAACCYYYERQVADDSYTNFASGYLSGSTNLSVTLPYQRKRVKPSIALSNVGVGIGAGSVYSASIGGSYIGKTSATLNLTISGGSGTAGNGGGMVANNNSAAYVELSAEL